MKSYMVLLVVLHEVIKLC